jgi:23S rRNA (adenine2503-C2)-methyltransferase
MININDLQTGLEKLGIAKFRAAQIFNAVYKEGKIDYAQMSTLPKDLREKLSANFPILSVKPARTLASADKNTIKILFELNDGNKIESVLMKFRDGRNSICVSSQVGCQMGCIFCGTGKMKFARNLTSEEISDQVLYCSHLLSKTGQKVTNVIYMGMGEPFMNYDNVIASIKTLNDKKCLNIGIRSITVSTCGICEGIEKLADSGLQVNLAVSLHAAEQKLREKIMPIARKYTLSELMNAIGQYVFKTNRRVTYEYVMLKDTNDSEDDAHMLAALLKGQLCHINLIPYNATETSGFENSPDSRVARFVHILKKAQIPVTVRVSLGQDIMAACGQLAATPKRSGGA